MKKPLIPIYLIAITSSLTKLSLPYKDKGFQRKETEDGLKIEAMFQSVLDPVQPQAKETFVNALIAINQSRVV